MKLNLRVEFLDGRVVDPLSVQMPDMLKFEEKFSISISALEKEQKLTYIVFLAWAALHRQKLTDKPFDDFVDTVQLVTASEADPK
jgi:hypothetical protein